MATVWKRMGAFLGLVEDYDDEYADAPDDHERERDRPPPPPVRQDHSNVRRIPTRGADGGATSSTVRAVPTTKIHFTDPTTFNDVEEVGEHFRNGVPTIVNLAGASESVAKRVLDFASGLAFGLEGRIERVGDRVFLLSPVGVEVSSEERRRLTERGFFNQA